MHLRLKIARNRISLCLSLLLISLSFSIQASESVSEHNPIYEYNAELPSLTPHTIRAGGCIKSKYSGDCYLPRSYEKLNIERKKEAIANIMQRVKMTRYAILGTLGATLAYSAWVLWGGGSSNVPVLPLASAVLEPALSGNVLNTNYTKQDQDMLKELYVKYAKPEPTVGLIGRTFALFKTQFKTVMELTAATALFQMIKGSLGPLDKYWNMIDGAFERRLNGIFHNDDLVWFIQYHTNFNALSIQLKEQPATLPSEEVASLWQMFIDQLESIIAFMEIKCELLQCQEAGDELIKNRARVIVDSVCRQTDDFCTVVKSSGSGFSVWESAFAHYRTNLLREFEGFALLEVFKVV